MGSYGDNGGVGGGLEYMRDVWGVWGDVGGCGEVHEGWGAMGGYGVVGWSVW